MQPIWKGSVFWICHIWIMCKELKTQTSAQCTYSPRFCVFQHTFDPVCILRRKWTCMSHESELADRTRVFLANCIAFRPDSVWVSAKVNAFWAILELVKPIKLSQANPGLLRPLANQLLDRKKHLFDPAGYYLGTFLLAEGRWAWQGGCSARKILRIPIAKEAVAQVPFGCSVFNF